MLITAKCLTVVEKRVLVVIINYRVINYQHDNEVIQCVCYLKVPIQPNLVNPDTFVPGNFCTDCECPDYRTIRIFDKILKICPDCERQLKLVREIKKGIDNTIIKLHAHNNISESLLKATNLLF